MDAIGKFAADLRRLCKYARHDVTAGHGEAAQRMAALFAAQVADLGSLPGSIAELWLKGALPVGEPGEVPGDAATDWLLEALAFLRGDEPGAEGAGGAVMSLEQWEEIRALVSAEAPERPIERLSGLMQALVDKGVV
jgi:hypothetical protein